MPALHGRLRVFVDTGQDRQFGELQCITAWVLISREVGGRAIVSVDLQWQGNRPEFGDCFRIVYSSLKPQGWHNPTPGLSAERTGDPEVVRAPGRPVHYL